VRGESPDRRSSRTALARKEEKPAMEDIIKFLMFVGALYGAYQSAKTAWRLGTELFG
jgi:hypothetical protein